ncbi:MAG: DNA-binding response regulator [Cytophagales bacterium CG12_big_fil_rev_8_21_14_0_65_40_12]|nr:MAG: DNA-binding response regulator [Cytophagales bacterium CG12_big_fil_rev_8_21_14_0_65_40_12]PIW03180.1 MAG: DNA-binding response regulator [Cytophagales bacterium CG17_big_fil_post_rev_8_21_14_2_50_40_13]
MIRILIIEDEPAMRLGLKDNLEFESYEVELAINGEEGLQKISNQTFDLIILDVMMPKMSGFDVCKAARKMGVLTPIIFLTAKSEEIDKVLGLELGADDYLTKPFSLRELVARVKAILRRSATVNAKPHVSAQKVGKLQLDFDQYSASIDGEMVRMSHKEFEIMQYLIENKNEVVSRYDLLNKVWGYDSQPTTRTVDNFILRLRQRIETNPNDPHHILTVHGIGYKLIL